MKRILFILSAVLVMSMSAYSQIYVDNQGNVHDQRASVNKKPTVSKRSNYNGDMGFDASKLSFGGGIGLQFGNYTVINVSPQVGYDFSKYITAGMGLGYTYYSDKGYGYKWNNSYLSFDLFARFYPVEFLVIGIQPEISRMWKNIKYNDGEKYNETKFVPSFLVGGGVRLGSMIAMLQYDIVRDNNSPYGDGLFYTIGYTFKF